MQSGIPANEKIELRVSGEPETIFLLEATGDEGCVIGRSDSKSSYTPDIDLAGCGALEKGVSRRHAVLVHFRDTVHLLDLDSSNGTFLNGERLKPNAPYALNYGDHIRLGTLNILLALSP